MVAHVLRLRLDLALGTLRGDGRHVIRTIVGLIALITVIAAVCWAVLQLRETSIEVATVVTVLAGSAVTLGFALAPLVLGIEDPLDPRRFAVFGIDWAPMAATIVLASLISVPVAALIAVGICLVVMWTALGIASGVAVLSVVLGILTCLLLARVSMAVAGLILRERRGRELTGLLLIGMLVVVIPIAIFLGSLQWGNHVPTALAEFVDILARTPLGAAWAMPAPGIAGWTPAAAVMTILVLGMLWVVLVRTILTSTERPISVRERHGLGWFTVMPGTPGGAIAARSLVYWFRDPRYIVNFVVVPVAAVLIVVPLLFVGVPMSTVALIPVPLMALFFGWLPHNDLAYDSTALWMHISSAVRGGSDRIGRLVPVTFIAVPLLAISIPIATSLHGRWFLQPALIGVCASLFLCGLGLSSISSVVAPYAASRPGDGPFEQPQRNGGGMTQAMVLFGAIVLSAPALWWGWQALSGDSEAVWTALWGGIGIGLGVLIVGLVIGGFVFQRSGGRLMEFAESS